jgi:hypothetical protein
MPRFISCFESRPASSLASTQAHRYMLKRYIHTQHMQLLSPNHSYSSHTFHMADDKDDNVRDLRRLAKRYGITIQSPPNAQQWPAVHQRLFESIRKIGDRKFDSFCASIDIRSNDEPWREQTKYRAEWLANRAARLFNQQRNESGWRFGLENDVLRRFSVEVAW